MKRLIATSLLIIALPFMASVNNQSAVYAGHVMVGGRFCDGDCVNGRCSGCGAACSDGQRTDSTKDRGAQPSPGATDALEPGFLLFVLAFFMVMKLRS